MDRCSADLHLPLLSCLLTPPPHPSSSPLPRILFLRQQSKELDKLKNMYADQKLQHHR